MITVIDSFGKPPSGILQGGLIWPGEYKECISVSESSINWESKYCALSSSFKSINISNQSNFKVDFKYGICMPTNCTQLDISSIFNQCKLFNHSLKSKSVSVHKCLFDPVLGWERNSSIEEDFLVEDIYFNASDVVCHYTKELDANSHIAMLIK